MIRSAWKWEYARPKRHSASGAFTSPAYTARGQGAELEPGDLMKLTFDNTGSLEISGETGDGDVVLRGPLSAMINALFEQLDAELCLTRDGRVALQFDSAPEVTIAQLVDAGAIHCKTLDEMVDALMAEIAEVPDQDDRADLIAFRTRLQQALSDVESALTRIDEAGKAQTATG